MTQSLKRGSPYIGEFIALFAPCGTKEFLIYASDVAVREVITCIYNLNSYPN